MSAQRVKHWMSDAPWNRHDVRGSRTTVDSAVAKAPKLVADLDAADPDWFVRRTEKLLNAPPTVAKAVAVETTPIPANTVEKVRALSSAESAGAFAQDERCGIN
jgi:hypothetical protein